jgi:hypothetical protein
MTRAALRPHLFLLLMVLTWLLVSCRSPQVAEEITVTVNADGAAQDIKLTAGSTVTQALQAAGVTP